MSGKFKTFLNKYMVTIVMVPALIGIHWGWYELNQKDALVPEYQRKGIPIFHIAEDLWNKVTGGGASASSHPTKEESK